MQFDGHIEIGTKVGYHRPGCGGVIVVTARADEAECVRCHKRWRVRFRAELLSMEGA